MAVVAAPTRRPWPRRPSATTGFSSWFTTVDHKKIGILYGVTAFFFFLVGGVEALLIRINLAAPTTPEGALIDADTYNQIFTMHGVTMVFFVVMPLGAAFFNYFIPLMIGARDVAFPRLNAFSYWVFLLGGLFVYSGIFLGGLPDGGWFAYAPLSSMEPGARMTFYAIGLQIAGVASLVAAVNFIVTILNLRAPGMSLMRMPVFVWMTLVVQFLLLFSLPILAIGLFQLTFDRAFSSLFFNPTAGGDPVLWQHLFWLFGHPEVYILILPAMGIVSEVLPVFSRKPLFGYAAIVFAGVAIGFIGFGVWAHHMFAVGLGAIANTAFGVSTMIIAVPTGIKIFNWLGTMWRGALTLTTPMLFAIGFVTMFVIGGLSGVTHAVVPADYQQTDTYYVVAHFHYVLFGGAIFGLFSGIYYWWPKFSGRMFNERLGKLHFWIMLIGFNLTFGPMHILGLQGMPRRQYFFSEGLGWDLWNMVSTIGAFTIAVSVLVFMFNAVRSLAAGERATADPWDARTLEWTIPSPPPPHNFDEIPTVHARDELWHRKYSEDRQGRPIPVVAGAAGEAAHGEAHGEAHDDGTGDEHAGQHGFHLPLPSYWPLVAAIGLPLIGYGLMFHWVFLAAGTATLLAGLYGWMLEPLE
ncbi:MAG TPA: cytochrome c oxidase subunit I [Actinomycetota bacterium]|nr:cytochrome c oxidase subunit I [Actinomycetota bacterium]